ncbi:MAG: hypothetical protein KGZ39_00995 [Simkania sp.]|nr:hypothetical protein [Simkania sp.]
MKRCLVLLLLLTACFSRTTAMTRESYDSITIGTHVSSLNNQLGKPDVVRAKGNDLEEYEYIERISINNDYNVENNYYLEVLNGIVVGKRMTSHRSPAYNIMYETEPNFSPNYSQYNP